MFEIKNLSVTSNNKKIINNINIRFEKNKIYAIMGPNGSGKSTLAHALMCKSDLILDRKSKILLNNRNIISLPPDKRFKKGIFVSFQSPLSFQSVNIFQILQSSKNSNLDIVTLANLIKKYARELKIDNHLLQRGLNDGASGGERKKMEVLQSIVLARKFNVFDEIDSGVDVDSLKTIVSVLKKYRDDKTYIFITHSTRILKYFDVDTVFIMKNGEVVNKGSKRLADIIEEKGFGK